MKKTHTKSRKLALGAETVRNLQDQELAAVAGGYTTQIWCSTDGPPKPGTSV